MSEKLPLVEFFGPALPNGDAFWVLRACVPEWRHQDKKAPQLDRIHAVRTLLADVAPATRDKRQWRLPRLMALHLITGAKGRFEEDQERFFVRLPDKTSELESKQGTVFHTFDMERPKAAVFQQVVAEPIYEDDKWPDLHDKEISAPSLRLVAGAIELRLIGDATKWLGPLVPKEAKDVVIRLTPDGIELEAKAPFPGRGELEGRFLLFPARGGTRLRLLPERLPDTKPWLEAWSSVTPATDKDEESMVGVKFEARRDGLPPAFVWNVEANGKIRKLSAGVEIPAADIRLRLLSPRGINGIDGEITVEPELFTLEPFDRPRAKSIDDQWPNNITPKLMLTAKLPGPPTPATRLVLDSSANKGKARLAGAHSCAHDEVALARELRAAYGFAELLPGTPDPERPLLSAFVPLDDGWLQLPVPNIPPPDLTKDENLTVPRTIPNVLSGYLRFAQASETPAVLSALPPTGQNKPDPFTVDEAPWVITIEGAQSLDFVLGLDPGGTTATLIRAAASLGNPELSTRGLVWISADRPDALESLPRLGAGAGAYLDIPLETFDIERKPILQFEINELGVAVERGAPLSKVSRTRLALAVAFAPDKNTEWPRITKKAGDAISNARKVLLKIGDEDVTSIAGLPLPLPPVIWQRHDTTPLAAAMPMTRAAMSAVRPLESRDLVPLVVEVPATNPVPMVRLTWPAGAVFPKVTQDDGTALKRRPVFQWPWPAKELTSAQGIGLAAFGVPGAEVALDENADFELDPWSKLRFALRYDLPVLDEAFATATLPPQPPEQARPEERETSPPLPLPVAYDWPAMHRFWDEQNRTHQLSRVQHSYLAAYRAIGNGNPADTDVLDLVGGLLWKKTKTGFKIGSGPLPYGEAVIGDPAKPVFGDVALLGLSGHFTFDGELIKVPAATPKTLEVLGYAPESFEDDDGFLFDSRSSGSRPAEMKVADALLWRELRIREPNLADRALATLMRAVDVGDLFSFWFKDLPVVNGVFERAGEAIDFSAWQDGQLPNAGFEWRLIPRIGKPTEIFKRGRDRIPFFGFLLEPLRLTRCALQLSGGKPNGRIESATIRARLHLGQPGEGNLVDLVLTPDGQGILQVQSLTGTNLRFAFDARENKDARLRRIVVAGDVSWKAGKPALTVTEFTVSMFGFDQPFVGAEVTPAAVPAGQPLVMAWSRTGSMTVTPGRGMFVVDKIRVETTVTDEGEIAPPALAIDRGLFLTPRGRQILETAAPTPAIEMKLVADDVGSLRIINLTLPGKVATFDENRGAFTLTVKAKDVDGQILSGFPAKGTLSLGLIARVKAAMNGVMELTAGWLDGELVGKEEEARVSLRRIAFRAEQMRRPERSDATSFVEWIGGMRLTGRLSLDSAISWPRVDLSLPQADLTKGGTEVVGIDGSTFHLDHVDYLLDGHTLPFDVAACIQDRKPDVVWAVPAVSRHTMKGKTKVSFTAVETIAIGAARAIVPDPGKPNAKEPELGFSKDPVTWAARHREVVDKDGDVTNNIVQGMVKAGVGRPVTVLAGALGLPFRAAFGTGHDGLFLAGGFAGLVNATDGLRAPLLRLPVLAAFDPSDPFANAGFISGKIGQKRVTVSWVDGQAARNVVATLRSAVTPASSSESALRSALLTGSRASSRSGLTPEETAMAILVEQYFDEHADNLAKGDLERDPFFVAAAVGLAKTIPVLEQNPAPVVLSLIAGNGGDPKRGLAAAVVTRNLPLTSADEDQDRLRAQLVTLGDEVVLHDWPGPPVANLEGVVPVALVAGPAFADHVSPRAVLVRTVSNGESQYDAPPLPRGDDRPQMAKTDPARSFADGGRGYGLDPGDGALRWLAGPEEGRTRPYRDDGPPVADVKEPQVSGLAGLSRAMALPAHATAKRDELVWVAQTRAPVYLPLGITDLESPPIPWLTPGTPRPRHVTSGTLGGALENFEFVKEVATNVQSILPTGATVASTGDRAGISLARIARLETAAGDITEFDGRFPRFGRPAQGGSWSVRTERTPRPAPLPPNWKDEERDRRPSASPLLMTEPLAALEGPADRVAGEKSGTVGRWTVTFVAAPEWNGMVTESWDGTLRVLAEIDVAQDASPGDAIKTLRRLLCPKAAAANTLQTRASLAIGGMAVPFQRVHFRPAKDFQPVGTIQRAVVDLVFDARPGDASSNRGAALAAIADAFTGPTLPTVEVKLVVHPDSDRNPDDLTANVLALTTSAEPALAIGDARAPVTLRLPLAPVVRSRGALPLAPTSLLFIDPAYDIGLSSAPAEDRARISAKGADSRGALTAVLYADRARINRRTSVTFMMDLAYEKKLDGRAERLVTPEADGDIIKDSAEGTFNLRMGVVPKIGGHRRDLFIATPSPVAIAGFQPPKQPTVPLAKVCELPLASLVETDGTAARLEPGDVLELQLNEPVKDDDRIKVKVLGDTADAASAIEIKPIDALPVSRILRFVLTDEPVVEPPPALYAALVRRTKEAPVRLSLPLYAQSPLPWRVDLRDAKRDFRRGLMRRAATFIWSLGRPKTERLHTAIHIVKVDRNGQTHLPEKDGDFMPSRPL